MNKYADIQYIVDAEENVKTVEVNRYRKTGEKSILEERVTLEKGGIYSLKSSNPIRNARDKSVVLQEFIVDELHNPLQAMVLFRESNTFGKVEVTELAKAK